MEVEGWRRQKEVMRIRVRAGKRQRGMGEGQRDPMMGVGASDGKGGRRYSFSHGPCTITDSAPCHSQDGWGSSCLWAPLARYCPAGVAPSTLPCEAAEGRPWGKARPQSLSS